MADTFNQAEVKRRFPVTKGLAFTDSHEGRQINLIPKKGSFVRKRYKTGMID